ncbi:transposase (plasmid) [Streptomyces sp. NBC_00841]|uniref:transposase n=1 Tax=Streptomyces sp. NBC_00841 TaxID=2975847 RepID=UPI002DD7DA51|nr:transposase [Streptomyces sp. NBC_00841]WSA04918.1 transposase [Streptomyces sp. NBC_00841]
MSKRYTPEFKRDAVALVRSSGRNVTEVARELGVSPEGLRGWVKQAKTDRGEGAPGALTTAEKNELQRLRRENREQQQTIEILKKAAVRSMGRCNIPGRTVTGGVAGWRGSGVRGCRTSRSVKCGGDGGTGSR